MNILVLGKGKTGSLVAEIAQERGHTVTSLDETQNAGAAALTAERLKNVDVAIDFTSPEAAVANITAVLRAGGRIVVGTTGWYAHLEAFSKLAAETGGALLYGTNFSIGVQKLFQLTATLAELEGYTFSIDETHHVTKLDAPSGTALTLKQIITAKRPDAVVEITSYRIADAKGEHIVRAVNDIDTIEVRHDATSRRGFALGAVRAAEWVVGKTGSWEFREIFPTL
ncbi:4-hydroxy-tetrahydrodipicolinate reductase [Telmatobacter bradus]|uniref:4-hydroxy-tetrahydrodipicolinate reductase n=1 Tax=Telmatobacter bradus TaxID=474953 RepID=UPI003B43AC98